jgi:homoserine O-succinyltransferase
MGLGVHSLLSRPSGGWVDADEAEIFNIGLVNNMPDAALENTERQFFRLMSAAAPELRIRWHLFSMRSVPRSVDGNLHLVRQYYGGARDLYRTELDALIVTGTEPHQADLRQEAYWPELAELLDWIEHEELPALFSCLAAHAAVLHFDRIVRRKLSQKRFGFFDHAVSSHALTATLAGQVRVAHSRWNELPADTLSDAGYRVLTCSPEAGPDLFLHRKRDDLLFAQGHPEYEPDTLAREYRRDVRRYLSGASGCYPQMPFRYFDAGEGEILKEFESRALRRRDERLMDDFPIFSRRREQTEPAMAPVFGAWLRQIDDAKIERLGLKRKQRHLAELHTP